VTVAVQLVTCQMSRSVGFR